MEVDEQGKIGLGKGHGRRTICFGIRLGEIYSEPTWEGVMIRRRGRTENGTGDVDGIINRECQDEFGGKCSLRRILATDVCVSFFFPLLGIVRIPILWVSMEFRVGIHLDACDVVEQGLKCLVPFELDSNHSWQEDFEIPHHIQACICEIYIFI